MSRSVPRRQQQQPLARRSYERFRGSASERGYDWRWSKPGGVADQCKERDESMCQECLKLGGLAIAMEALMTCGIVADHRIPVHVRPDLAMELDNTQTLCVRHNGTKGHADNELYGAPDVPIENLTPAQIAARKRVGA